MQSRLSRFKRSSSVAPMQLTERDRAIIRLVHRHRFLRSSQIISLLDESPQQILRRLQLLYHHGFLERPRAQIDYYHQGGSRQIVYGLGNKGGAMLKQELGPEFHTVRWGEKNRSVGRLYFEHALLVSDVMVALELGCRKTGGIRLTTIDEFSPDINPGVSRRIKWSVKRNGSTNLAIIPDRAFVLQSDEESGDQSSVLFFLEADRGTMPVIRKNLVQSSFYRKLLAYEATWSQGLHRSHFGFDRFRVLTVTTTPLRVKSLVDACAELKSGHRLFLFSDQDTLREHGDIFTLLWKTGREGESSLLLN